MARPMGVVILFVALLASWSMNTVASAQRQAAATPITEREYLFTADGVDAPVLASAEVDNLSVAEPRLLLERIELAAGSSLPAHTAGASELLVVEDGELSIEDAFGFGSTVETGEQLAINADAQYTLANDADDDASLLRLSVTSGSDEENTETGNASASPAGTPVSLSPAATPISLSDETEFLLDQPLEQLPSGPVTLFISHATFEPGAESGEQAHAGPLGIYIEDGTLSILSPSGVVGELDAGRAVALPAEASFIASNEGNVDANVLLVGVVESGQPLLGEVTPEPTPTVIPTQTPVPTAMPESTATTVPTPTQVPTSTPEPTQIPTPTPIPTTEVGTILQAGQGWRAEDASLTLTLEKSGVYATAVILFITYRNLEDSRVDFVIPSDVVRVYDDQRQPWEVDVDQMVGDRVILDPEEDITYEVWSQAPDGDYSANVFIVVNGFGAVPSAKWGYTFDKGRILTLPPDAVDPTDGGAAASDSGPQLIVAVADAEQLEDEPLQTLLPSQDDVTQGLVTLEEGSFTADEITVWFIDPTEASNLFQQWGWQENAFRTFVTSNGEPLANGLTKMEVSAQRFADPESAAAALDYICDVRRIQLAIVDGTVELIGDQSRAIGGQTPDGLEVSVYVRRGNDVIRVTAKSASGDPTADAVEVARFVGSA